MIAIPQKEADARWDLLPEKLRDELVSDTNIGFIWKTCQGEHLPEEKIYSVSRITGAVIMGFLHPEDMANEIRDELGIDLRIAAAIASAINQRIFTPIRADIDKAYQPIAATAAAAEPKIVQEIRPAPTVSKLGAGTPPPMSIPVAPIAPPALKSAAPMPSPAQKPAPSFVTPPSPMPSMPVRPSPVSVAARPSPATAPAPTPAPAPKPIMFQTQAAPRPIQNAPDFRIPKVAENIMGENASRVLPIRSAIVEIGGIPKPATPSQIPQPSIPGMPRYGGEKIEPPKPEPTRTITEVTPEAFQKTDIPVPKASPAPFTPILQTQVPSSVKPPIPAPAPAPMPKATPGKEEKVIQKDYSEPGK